MGVRILFSRRDLLNPALPQCTATRDTKYASDVSPRTKHRCKRKATVEFDGQYLCMQHAGPLAIEKLIKLEGKK